MADLVRAFLQRSKYLLASKKAHNLPNSIKMERITTQEVCTGLRSILDAVATENLDAIKSVVDVLLVSSTAFLVSVVLVSLILTL